MPYWSRMIVTRSACFFHFDGCADETVGTTNDASSRVAAMAERSIMRMKRPTVVDKVGVTGGTPR